MAKIINLRTVRKAKQRQADRAKADENAAKFSLTKAGRNLQLAIAEQARRNLDGHERE